MTALRRALCAALLLVIMVAANPVAQAQGGTGEGTPAPNTTIHVVQRGENLFRIALQYGTTVEAIARANGIADPTAIQVGQRLIIPNASPDRPGIPTDYVVGPGDSLLKVAARFGTTIQDISVQNKIVNPAQLYIGLRITLPVGSNTTTATTSAEAGLKNGWIHVVQSGENLYRIASRYGVLPETIARLNSILRPSTIYTGERLVIPGDANAPPLVDLPYPFTALDMLPGALEQGRTVTFRISTSVPSRIQGTLLGRPVTVESNDARTGHVILFGSDSLTPPGIYTLHLAITTDDGTQTSFDRAIELVDGGYTSEKIQLAPELKDLLDPAITGPESNAVLQIVSKVTPQRYFGGPMGIPCPAPVTSQFGTRRSYNGGPYNNVHTGTDFAAMPGSAIYAPAAGVVVFVGTLNVRGNATLIDHGWGIFTGYWHQTSIAVKVGDVVQQGQIIGTVGSTGRVTGPHLHWEVFVGGVQVDPLQWVRQSFP